MEYNTSREKLSFREYGRHIQKMVANCAKEEDPEKRQIFANYIIELMGQLNPHLRNVEEYRHKLWDHLHIISKGDLDVETPYPKPSFTEYKNIPAEVPYPNDDIRHRHYGKGVERMIEAACAMEDEEKRNAYAEAIGNYMKLVYQSWNKENVNDEQIKLDLKRMSDGVLDLGDESRLNTLTKHQRSQGRSKGGYSKSRGKKRPSNKSNNKNFRKRNYRR